MKRMKRILAILLAAIMVMSMGTSVFASNDASILISTTDQNRTYSAYLIFSGEVSNGSLTDIAWGSGVDTDKINANDNTNLYTVLKADTTVISVTVSGTMYTTVGALFTALLTNNTAAEVATVLSYVDNDDALMVEFAKVISNYLSGTATVSFGSTDYNSAQGGYYAENLASGYYLIVDTTNVSSATDNSASRYMLKVAAAATITPKTVVPTLEKQIKISDTTTGSTTTASIGDSITYLLTSAVPDMTGYSTYTFTVTDTLTSGLTLDEVTGTVVSAYSATPESNAISSAYSASVSAANALNLSITIGTTALYGIRVTGETDAAVTDGSPTIVSAYDYYYYTSTDSGNTTLTIVFVDFINRTETAGTAITITYTATLDEDAVIGTGTAGGNANSASLTYSNNPNTGSETDTGTTTKSTVSVFTFELDLTKVDATNTSTTLSGAEFLLYYTEGSDTYYAVVDNNGKVTDWTTTRPTSGNITSDTNGKFTVSGLGVGTYTLEETVAPSGYKTASFEVVISAEIGTSTLTTSGYAVETLTATITGTTVTTNTTNGTITASITNSSESAIPGTGGIGTTIFYIVGAVLVLGAGVILITRRRMASR